MSARVHLCGRLRVEWDGERLEAGAARAPGPAAVRVPDAAPRPARAPRRAGRGAVVGGGRRRPAATRCCARRCRGCAARSAPGRLEGRGELAVRFPDRHLDRPRGGARRRCGASRAALRRRATRAASWDAARDALAIAERGLLPGLEARWLEPFRASSRSSASSCSRRSRWPARGSADGELSGGRAGRPARGRGRRRSASRRAWRCSRSCARRGNVAEALVAFDEFRTFLRDELGTAPGAGAARAARGRCSTRAGRAARGAAADARRSAPARAEPAAGFPTGSPRPWPPRGWAASAALARLREEADRGGRRPSRPSCSSPARAASARRGWSPSWPPACDGFDVLYGRCDEEELFPYGPWVDMLRPRLARMGRR